MVAVFSISMCFYHNASFAQNADTNQVTEQHNNTDPKEEEDFDVAASILDHIRDHHSWHLWGHTSIHLPVILKTDKGFEAFSSSRLSDEHHQPVVYNGNYPYKQIE